MKVAIAQIAPVLLNRDKTIEKVVAAVNRAADEGCRLVAFGESFVPAYPMWLCRTDGARFDADDQKRLHALYLDQAVRIGDGEPDDLAPVCEAARRGVAVVLGVAERVRYTLNASRVFIGGEGDAAGRILSVHRKLVPTYEERLAWGPGDGAGLVTHRVGDFAVGALNCWENWMPLARAALYAAGEDLHVMLWPGCLRLTEDITRFVARESRSFVISASGIIREPDIPTGTPERDRMAEPDEVIYDGGSCIAGPDGSWVVEPVVDREDFIIADLDPARVREERQNFDPAGHYSRPDVLALHVNRARQ